MIENNAVQSDRFLNLIPFVKTDTLFYQLFQTFPRFFFELIDLPLDTANLYQFSSVEVKQLAFRIDGVFLPHAANQPIYFLEVQFQPDTKFYSRFFSEIFLYLYKTELTNDWRGVIIYPRQGVDTGETTPYAELLNSGRISRIYLDELDNLPSSVGFATLQLVITDEESAIERGRRLIERVREELNDEQQQQELLQLIETILVYKLPRVSRQEIEAMFSLSDLKHTKVYQEAFEEGKQEGKQEGKLESVSQLLRFGLSVEQIAQALGLEIKQVRQVAQKPTDESK